MCLNYKQHVSFFLSQSSCVGVWNWSRLKVWITVTCFCTGSIPGLFVEVAHECCKLKKCHCLAASTLQKLCTTSGSPPPTLGATALECKLINDSLFLHLLWFGCSHVSTHFTFMSHVPNFYCLQTLTLFFLQSLTKINPARSSCSELPLPPQFIFPKGGSQNKDSSQSDTLNTMDTRITARNTFTALEKWSWYDQQHINTV